MDIPGEGEGGKSRVCMPKSGSERGLHLDLGYTFFFNSFPSGLPSTHRLLICSILPSTQSCYSARLNWDRPRSPRPRLPKYLFVFRVGLFFFFFAPTKSQAGFLCGTFVSNLVSLRFGAEPSTVSSHIVFSLILMFYFFCSPLCSEPRASSITGCLVFTMSRIPAFFSSAPTHQPGIQYQ